MMTKAIPTFALFLVAFVLPLAMPGPVQAGGCAETAVAARGEESRYVWLAKVKARAVWRQKVRTMPGLGPNYANWARAQNTEERCLTGGAGTICIFTGTPCLP
jgi:hypothetical protein